MNEEFLEEFADVFDADMSEMKMDFKFDGPESWDSLAIISTLALIDQYYGIALKAEDFINCPTLGDLLDVIKSKKGIN